MHDVEADQQADGREESEHPREEVEPLSFVPDHRVEEDVRLQYQQARSEEPSVAAITFARRIAEAVSLELANTLPPEERDKFRTKKKVGARLEELEKRAEAGLGPPRFIVSALRTLQAYGNTALHYEK